MVMPKLVTQPAIVHGFFGLTPAANPIGQQLDDKQPSKFKACSSEHK